MFTNSYLTNTECSLFQYLLLNFSTRLEISNAQLTITSRRKGRRWSLLTGTGLKALSRKLTTRGWSIRQLITGWGVPANFAMQRVNTSRVYEIINQFFQWELLTTCSPQIIYWASQKQPAVSLSVQIVSYSLTPRTPAHKNNRYHHQFIIQSTC